HTNERQHISYASQLSTIRGRQLRLLCHGSILSPERMETGIPVERERRPVGRLLQIYKSGPEPPSAENSDQIGRSFAGTAAKEHHNLPV
ncbi:hypothetical protein ABTE25_19970, partial [Acinetobacter baumannii]